MRQRGFTVVEVLVALSITAVLLAIVLPAVQVARESGRRTTCAYNLRQVSMGVLAWTEARGRFPPSAVWKDAPEHESWNYHNWVVEILPMLDRVDIADHWNHDESLGHPTNQTLAATHLAQLVCPSDSSASGFGDLSYALNRGVGLWVINTRLGCDIITDAASRPVDLNGDGRRCAGRDNGLRGTDRAIYRRTSLFFDAKRKHVPNVYRDLSQHHSPRDVVDGLSNTIMVGENVRTGYDSTALNGNWASTDGFRTAIFFSSAICRNRSCTDDGVHLSLANSGEFAVNSGLGKAEGAAPWPNSDHRGGVNIAFADGRVQFLSETVDGSVYFNLFTPQGAELAGTPLGDSR